METFRGQGDKCTWGEAGAGLFAALVVGVALMTSGIGERYPLFAVVCFFGTPWLVMRRLEARRKRREAETVPEYRQFARHNNGIADEHQDT